MNTADVYTLCGQGENPPHTGYLSRKAKSEVATVRCRAARPSVLFRTICLLLACGVPSQPFLGQGTSSTSLPETTQNSHSAPEKVQRLFRIEVEDATEAGLIEQQLKIRPALFRDRSFYYYGNGEINPLLRRYGYEPVQVNSEDVFTRVVRVIHRGEEEDLSKAGVTILLREHEYWIVRATSAQLRLLKRLGYQVEELGRREPRPRQVRIVVSRREQVAEVGAHRVDIYSAAKSERGYVILGGAFDDAIDELRAAGFHVDILADPPGVIR